MPDTATLGAGVEHLMSRFGDSLSATASEVLSDLSAAAAERSSLAATSPEQLTDQVEDSLRALPAPDPGAPPAQLDYGDELQLDPIALEHVLMASRKLHSQTAEQASRLGPGLLPGPGPSVGWAVGRANTAIPAALRSHLEQWELMCSDISSFKDANTAADSLAARCLAPSGGGEL